MPAAYVKPHVKRRKTDAANAEAICEAVTRTTMRFVAVKSVDQQAVLMLHKTRDLLVRQRIALINALRAQRSEYGIVTSKWPSGVTALLKLFYEGQESCQHMRGRRCIPSVLHCDRWQAGSTGLIHRTLPGTVPVTPAVGLRPFLATVRSPRLRSPQLYLMHRYSAPAASSRHEQASHRGPIAPAERSGLAASASMATDTSASCWSSARLR